ncbi:MAG: transcription termination factor Rho, partial [Bacteroidetes bacterium]
MYDILQLNDMLVPELKEIASNLGIKGYHKLTKQDIIYKILDQQALAEKKSGGEFVPVVEEPAPGRKVVVQQGSGAKGGDKKAAAGKRPRKATKTADDAPQQTPVAEKRESDGGRERSQQSRDDRRDDRRDNR